MQPDKGARRADRARLEAAVRDLIQRSRIDRGLPPTITDPEALRRIGVLVEVDR